MSTLFAMLSPIILILASIDRLLISSQNVDTRLYSSKRLAYFSISIVTVFWILFNLHVLIKVNIQEIYPTYFVCSYDSSETYLNFISYALVVIDVLMIILCIFAFKNVRRIRAIPREKRHQIRSMTKKDFQLRRCLFVQNITFIIFSSWISMYYVYNGITKNQIQTLLDQAIHTFLNNLVTFIYGIYYCTSFFYMFDRISKAFRHELKRMIGKDVIPLREEENVARNNVEINVVSVDGLPA